MRNSFPVNMQEGQTTSGMIPLNEFHPVSELVVSEHLIKKAKHPVIDAHNHLRLRSTGDSTPEDLISEMDRFNIRLIVDLDGHSGGGVEQQLKRFVEPYPDRFTLFLQYDISDIDSPDFAYQIRSLTKKYCERGISGIKFLKWLGLRYKDKNGIFIKPDDDRLKPIWESAARYDLPVTIHIADPIAFFKPITPENERYEELFEHPHWSFADPRFYRFEELMESQERLLEKNPDTRYIVAHVGSNSENLKRVGQLLDKYPNMFVDTAERIADLGRQPYSSREFLIKYQDRVLYGTDLLPNETNVSGNYRFFETMDEYFTYNSLEEHNQGRWYIYGVGLPDEVLQKIYFKNALKVIPKLRAFYHE
ncbi:MAG: amidohydrolase family protein [Chloroflexi bacterium]|nr:amidohydrolase family protein [Chloroflexota bacterium]